MAIKVNEILKDMLGVAKTTFGEDWPKIKDYSKTELKGIAESIALIERLRLEKKISQKHAKMLIKMKKNTAQIILLSIKGMGKLTVEKAINSALKVVKDTVNSALNFKLL